MVSGPINVYIDIVYSMYKMMQSTAAVVEVAKIHFLPTQVAVTEEYMCYHIMTPVRVL